jgi:pimeloyl-ACP methyl ester carboxylesterase
MLSAMPFLTNADVPIHYEVTGQGPALLLLHGAGSSAQEWDDHGYIGRLAPHFTVITIDQRGHGQSGRPSSAEAYSPVRRMSDVLAVMDVLEIENAHVFGYSMGGWNAMRFAMAHPERVRSLVLGGFNPYPMSVNAPLVAPMRKMSRGRLWRIVRDDFFLKVRQRLFPDQSKLFVSASTRATTEPIDIELAVERVTMPVLMFIAEFDQTFDVELGRQFAERLHSACFEMVRGEDHGVNRRSGKVLSLVEPFLLEQP